MDDVFQSALPVMPWTDPRLSRLPGTLPLDPADWLRVDDAYAGQMALRDHLIARCPAEVHAMLHGARAAADELCAMIAPLLPVLGFARIADGWRRPDSVVVPADAGAPLLTLGRLLQQDFCLMQTDPAAPAGAEHVLTGAILCFPAGWTLSEKLGRGLARIHQPVPPYDPDVARRVQRLFDAIRPGQALWRANAHLSAAPLHNPRREQDGHATREVPTLIRSERQCLLRLPETRAVVFSIHTVRVRLDDLPREVRAALAANPIRGAA